MDARSPDSVKTELLDPLLQGLVQFLERAFPRRIRSYYLGGSYSDGTAVGQHSSSPHVSDVDFFVIFRGTITEDETATFQQLVADYQSGHAVQIDAHACSEDDLRQAPGKDATQTSFLNVLIRQSSILVFGEDLRADLPPIRFERYVLDVIESGIFHVHIPRQHGRLVYPLATPLAAPLTYPDPMGEFYGYDVIPARPKAPRGTRVLVALTAWIATLILALETGLYAGQKSQSIRLCEEHLPHDQRVQLAASIYHTCKETWRYLLPTEKRDREQLRRLCQDTLHLENEYLQLCHQYALTRFRQAEEDEKRQASHILQSIVFKEDGMTAL